MKTYESYKTIKECENRIKELNCIPDQIYKNSVQTIGDIIIFFDPYDLLKSE